MRRFDSYRGHSDPSGYAGTRMVTWVMCAADALKAQTVHTPVHTSNLANPGNGGTTLPRPWAIRPMDKAWCTHNDRAMTSTDQEDRRQSLLTRRCAWCKRVDTRASWRPERRAGSGAVSDGICPTCLVRLLPMPLPPSISH